MATRTIANGGGNWSANATWVEGVAPTAADNVVATATSGAVTIDGTSGAPNLCRSADFTGYTSTLTHASLKQLNIGDGTAGAFKLVAGMTYTVNTAAVLKFVSTTTGNNITWAGKNSPTLIFDGVGGSWQYQDAPANGNNTYTITLTNGSLDLNGKSFQFGTLSSNNSNTRSLTIGAGTLTMVNSGTFWDIGNSSGMTLSAASSTILPQFTASTAGTFAGGGLTYGTLSTTGIITTGSLTISGSNTFGTLTLSVSSTTKNTTSGFAITAGTTQTVTGTFTANGNSTLLRNFIYSTIVGTTATISAATVSVTHTDFRDIAGAGAGSWNFSGLTATANGDAGGNSGITFTSPKNCYMKTAVSVNWSGSNWFTTSGGSTPITPVMPLVHDHAIFDANSVTAGSRTITLDEPRMPDCTWNGVLNTPAFATSTAYELYGSLILVSGMTHTGGVSATFMGRGAYSLDGGGLIWPTSSTITLNAPTGTLSLSRNFSSNAALTISGGTFGDAGFTGVFTGAITLNGGKITLGGNGLSQTSASMVVSSGTIAGNNYYITTGSGTVTFQGGGGGSYTFG